MRKSSTPIAESYVAELVDELEIARDAIEVAGMFDAALYSADDLGFDLEQVSDWLWRAQDMVERAIRAVEGAAGVAGEAS
jgi:hypothetical protein